VLEALSGEWRTASAHDPLGHPIEARYALVREGETAVVDVAAASGLALVAESELDAEAATSAGTGELIAAAVEAGAQRILIGAGGSATTDGGDGAIKALEAGGGLHGARLEVLCDTTVPFEDAAAVFAPQKGAAPDAVARLTQRLVALAGALSRDPRGRTMSGAAGGLAGGLWAAFGAHLIPGAATVLGILGFDERLARADAAITGEGRLDEQSFEGKLVGQVARRCREAQRPLHVIAGSADLDGSEASRRGIASISEAGTPEAITRAAARIVDPAG